MNAKPRRFNRRTSFIIAEYRVHEGYYRDIIKNIGPQGAFINTHRTIAEGQEILLRFPLFSFDKVVEISGKVNRATHRGFAVTFDHPIQELIGRDGGIPAIVHEIDR